MTEEVMEQVREKIAAKIENANAKVCYHTMSYNTCLEIADQILSIPEILIKDPDQSYPDMVFYCPNCEKMVKNTKCNVIGKDCFKVLPKEKSDK